MIENIKSILFIKETHECKYYYLQQLLNWLKIQQDKEKTSSDNYAWPRIIQAS